MQLHLVAVSCTICRSHSRRRVRKMISVTDSSYGRTHSVYEFVRRCHKQVVAMEVVTKQKLMTRILGYSFRVAFPSEYGYLTSSYSLTRWSPFPHAFRLVAYPQEKVRTPLNIRFTNTDLVPTGVCCLWYATRGPCTPVCRFKADVNVQLVLCSMTVGKGIDICWTVGCIGSIGIMNSVARRKNPKSVFEIETHRSAHGQPLHVTCDGSYWTNQLWGLRLSADSPPLKPEALQRVRPISL
jgi:hypothetical protein